MRAVTVQLYQFSELPTDRAKEKAREWLRQCEASDYEAEFEFAETAAALLGIDLAERSVGTNRMTGATIYASDIRYSGFYSQGDGASFVGRYAFAPGCAQAIRNEWPKDEKLHAIADGLTVLYTRRKLLGKSGLAAKITQDGRYYHKHTMGLEYCVAGDNEDEEISAEEEEALLELMRDFAQWIYDGLREDYEYRLSDEALDETMEANEYEFTEDGKRA